MIKNSFFTLSLNNKNINNVLASGFTMDLFAHYSKKDTIELLETPYGQLVIHKNSCNIYSKVIC